MVAVVPPFFPPPLLSGPSRSCSSVSLLSLSSTFFPTLRQRFPFPPTSTYTQPFFLVRPEFT